MADYYVRSTDGIDADSGATWALAKASINGFAAADAAGDTCYVSQVHADSTGSSQTWALAGTVAAPTRIIGVSDASEPPTAVATGASVTTTANAILTKTGSFYERGITYFIGTGTGSPGIINQNGAQVYEDCSFQTVATGNAYVKFGESTRTDLQKVTLKNVTFKFASTGARINIESEFRWEGGSILAGGATPVSLCYALPRTISDALITGVDFSNLASTFSFFNNAITFAFHPIVRNCKLPAGWPSGSNGLFNAAPTQPGVRAEMHNCDGGDTNYRLRIEDYAGTITTEIVVVCAGGSTDGATPYSLKLASTANANATCAPLDTPELPAVWSSVVGAPVTVTVDVLSDGANLTDGEIWLDVQYLGTSGFPLSIFASDAKTDILAAPADQAVSTANWTTTGLTTPNKQKLSVTITPQEAGFIQARVVLAKASKTVYVDNKLQVA